MQAKYIKSTPVMAERFDGSTEMANRWGMCHQLGESDQSRWYWNREEFEPVPFGKWLVEEFGDRYDVSDDFFKKYFQAKD